MKFNVTFRLDDITPAMHWEKFNLLRSLFDQYNICPLLCIIPNNKNKNLDVCRPLEIFWNQMRILKEKGWVIGQHGYTHFFCTKNKGLIGINSYSEFAGLSYQEQCEKIKQGKLLLQEQKLNSDIWVAPAHTFDHTTLRALYDNGFQYVSDGLSLFPYVASGLKFIPCQRGALKYIFPYGMWTIVIHPNIVTANFLMELEKFIIRYRVFCINYSQMMKMKPVNSLINRLSKLVFLIALKTEFFRNKYLSIRK